ncbi:MAG: GAF domain-containing protein [Anaerolineae bacterium]|nr:GAF domain-containing protein [Anaerolineae bacterium]
MWNRIRKLTTPPFFEQDAEETRKARLLNSILWPMLVLVGAITPILLAIDQDPESRMFTLITMAVMVPATMGAILLMHRGRVQTAGAVLSFSLLVILTLSIYKYGGIRNTTSTGYLLVILLAGLLMDRRGALIFGLLSMVSVLLIYAFESGLIGELPYYDAPTGPFDLLILFAMFVLMAVLLFAALRSINNALELALHNERSLAETNRQLSARTQDLERRSVQLQAAAEVSRTAISVRDLDALLSQVTHLISEQFGFYHTGIFLLDEADEYAVLQAANSAGGQRMLEEGHRLKVGKQGVVGYVTGTGEPHIVLDVGTDAVHFNNPLLPETRSEMALPLKLGAQIIGALDVQSKQEGAFDEKDATVLQTMADQLAIAIENARLLHEAQQTVHELSTAAAEMLAVATQQMSGANEQSAAITQTTTTVEEVRTISEQAVVRAQEVIDASQRTVETSRAGQKAVRQNIAEMAHIKERVESIAENILALSEQTQQIGEIITTVSNIAVQSNMLALNASVEAARAGEHGKGFAVVAAEVRNLAQQSRHATAQVKAILSDIQSGIDMTVMSTEEGTKVVDSGVRLVAETQAVIEQLTNVIDESAQAAMQMVAGGQQQASGVGQIAMAMQSINQATQQNLASTLQVEKTAQDLNELSLRLTETVEQYQG